MKTTLVWAQAFAAEARRQARQLVNHGHMLVNGRKVDIPSYQIKIGDVISNVVGKSGRAMLEALAAGNQDKFWEMADLLFELAPTLDGLAGHDPGHAVRTVEQLFHRRQVCRKAVRAARPGAGSG